MEIYDLLNYKILDTSSEIMQNYNFIYIPFNLVEALIWFIYIPKTWIKYKAAPKDVLIWQSISFLLFGLSDLIETNSTTVLLILFKAAILVSLINGHKAIKASLESAKPC